MHLATLTCNRDIRQTLLQAESIQKFVNPCTHWVIVNQYKISDDHKRRWFEYLNPFYTKHKLELIFPEDIQVDNPILHNIPYGTLYNNGWKYQFTVAKLIKDDYLCLTPKNFFIKNVELENYRNVVGNGTLINNIMSEGQQEISKFLNQTPPDFVFSSHPPMVMNYKVLTERLGDMTEFDKFWDRMTLKTIETNGKFGIMDWQFYSYLMANRFHWTITKDAFNSNIRSLNYEKFSKDPLSFLDNVYSQEKVVTLGMHRQFLEYCNENDLMLINQWLSNKGLTVKLKKLKYHKTINI